MQSPLSGLCEVLSRVKALAVHKDYEIQLKTNEKQTRAALIDPILTALGWDIANPQQVENEKQFVTSSRERIVIDYFLKAECPIIVEAKKLGGNLREHFLQIAEYSTRTRSKSIFLTDGIIWQHHINTADALDNPTNSLNFNLAKCINLAEIKEEDLPREVAEYFVTHSDAALFLKPVNHNKAEEDLQTKVAELERTIRNIEAHLRLENVEIAVIDATPGLLVDNRPWKILNDDWDPTGQTPKHLRLPDKTEKEINGWKQVLWETCKFCLESKPEIMSGTSITDCSRSGTRALVGVTRPQNSNKELVINGMKIFVDCNYSAITVLKNAVYMLEKLGEGTAAKAAVLLAE
jgi:hypothetical protein